MRIKENKHGFEKEFQAIKREYVRDIKGHMHRLEALLEQKRWEDIYQIGHQLRGSGESYGFKEVSNIGGNVQKVASKHDAVKLRQWLSKLQEILEKLKAER
jgi:HPt (histidine-containing phosphotransfer) domain-containing protein